MFCEWCLWERLGGDDFGERVGWEGWKGREAGFSFDMYRELGYGYGYGWIICMEF